MMRETKIKPCSKSTISPEQASICLSQFWPEAVRKQKNVGESKIRGVRKEESNSFILLADALCGLVRDANDGDESASGMLHKMKKEDILTAL